MQLSRKEHSHTAPAEVFWVGDAHISTGRIKSLHNRQRVRIVVKD